MKHQIRPYLLLVIFLFGGLLPSQTQEELTRLPMLWTHYQAHKAQIPSTSFYDFFQQHYGTEFTKHRSAHDHSKLPMKSGENHIHAPVPMVLPTDVRIASLASLHEEPLVVFKDQTASQSFLSDIWQPPRNC